MFEIPMDELQASLPAFERLLLAHGYGIDYTQDFSGGSQTGGTRGLPMRFQRILRARRPGLRHKHRGAHDIGEYQQRWGPSLHMCAHKQSPVHGPNEGVQQGRIELQGRRDPGTHWRPSGRLCRQPERACVTHLASRCTGPSVCCSE